jgi:hypothetical protein
VRRPPTSGARIRRRLGFILELTYIPFRDIKAACRC